MDTQTITHLIQQGLPDAVVHVQGDDGVHFEALVVSPLLDSREVAAYLKVSESTLSRWRSAGTGPPFLRLGGIARYRLDAVDRWLAELEQLFPHKG